MKADWKLSERTTLVPKVHRISEDKAELLRKCAVGASVFTLIVLGTMAIVTLVIGVRDDSLPSFAFSLDALLDCMSSAVVIWRFTGAGNTLYSSRRERIACLTLGAFFILSSTIIAGRAGAAIRSATKPDPDSSSLIRSLSGVNFFICACLAALKIYLAHQLESVSIATDAVNSGIGVLLSMAAIIGDVTYEMNKSVWYIDSVLGCVCAAILLVFGLWLIVYEQCSNNGHPRATAGLWRDISEVDAATNKGLLTSA
ncbi:hypothetical protein CAPTEDRAFT_225963 [Capitella teleta]|uniref:Uncharacterized protein n=1 Tax=Capitella teleta TaxID=283909 RepID=R7U4N5_CAPTE|nr:hypothetical protein CAPTEDRAFT_225963 [Capitella teleta]|eukprot:ELT98125.1 hypothetical protein CAPTEDRAFT_225963 [Capitella teleta]